MFNMILTEKCLEKYTEWYSAKGMEDFNNYKFSIDVMAPMFFALMQVFFESINIEIAYKKGYNIKTGKQDGFDWLVNDYIGFSNTKILAISECIKKANEKFNNQ